MGEAQLYPATRYRIDTPADLGTRKERERLSAPALRAFFNIMARWTVRDEDARALLGGVSNGPFYEMKRRPDRVLEVDDRQMAEIAIVENLQRRDLDALEKAASFKQYLANWQCTQEELAKRLSVDRSTVANLIRLLDLPGDVQQLLRAGSISMGHARALLPIGDEPVQVRLARRVVDEGLSVRAVEAEVKEILRNDEDDDAFGEGAPGARRGGRPVAKRPAQIIAMENDLRRALGTKVVVQATSKGSGKIVIPFADADEFQRLLEFLTAEVV